MSRLAREHPDDEQYQSLGGQREALVSRLDINEDGTLTPPELGERRRELRRMEEEEQAEHRRLDGPPPRPEEIR